MLASPPRPRDSDGVCARYWYDSGRYSTGFAGYRPRAGPLAAGLDALAEPPGLRSDKGTTREGGT